jgi:UDP-N-acetylmuramoyl-L-alanyl-D-glutamate--2,6-diaminopimelate ligase
MRRFLQPLYSVYHWLWALAGALFHGFPSRRLTVIGVTGTKGKSTAAELIAALLAAGGKKAALLTSVWTAVGDERVRNASGNSMPGRGRIQAFLRRALQAGCTHVIIEVTSEGVAQHRHRFIDWDAAVFLNLAPEHLERHGSFERYRAAKVAFFSSLARSAKRKRLFFVNRDDGNARYFLEAAERVPGARVVEFGEGDAPLVRNPWFAADFNKLDAAAAAAVAGALGVPEGKIEKTLESFRGVPGRLEYLQRRPFAVVVDYAHTPDSLGKVYRYLSNSKPKAQSSKLICILGSAGGGRDKWKRPKMGEVASCYCDEIFLTNEDPYDENPSQILSEIKSGISNSRFPNSNVHEVLDRREAIEQAVARARPGDTVVMTGKGSESSIHIAGGRTVPWSDSGAAREALRLREQ